MFALANSNVSERQSGDASPTCHSEDFFGLAAAFLAAAFGFPDSDLGEGAA